MSVSRTIEAKAGNGKMTFGELSAFVAEMEAAGAAESTQVGATATMGGWLKAIKATVTERAAEAARSENGKKS